MAIAFLYAGQGSQKPGMGRDLYAAFPEVQEIFDYSPLGSDLKRLCFDAELSELSLTENTQPAMGAFAAAVTRVLALEGVTPDFAMGLSLGEYSALHSAGVFDWREMLDLLAFRGSAMAECSRGVDFKMSAVLTSDAELVERAVTQVEGDVWCCNYNCPGQTVIGGLRADVERAESLALELGARRCMPLNVGGPFHTPLMRAASDKLEQYMQPWRFSSARFPVVTNVTGEAVEPAADVKPLLTRQVMSPVRFEVGLRTLAELGVTTFAEIGPGSVLSGFVKKTLPSASTLAIETVEDLRSAVTTLKEARS
ncbi:MAG: ACP S-malonyltransferase [Oscillospiraceae bacterium]|jgi:[acyl-carrier-protein] S-malonyltransferase|nr:ACP S-malonyltransferase [Oscillospiraceae bacterium]